MGAIRLIQKPENGFITFKVPDEMQDETIVIEFKPIKDETISSSLLEVSRDFFANLNLKKTDFKAEDYSVYDQ